MVHADRLIRHNTWRIAKQPVAHSQTDSEIRVVASLTADTEARLVVTFVKKVKKANPALGYKDFAVLYRTNAQSLPLQIRFILSGIPYVVRKEDNILTNDELEKLLGALRFKRDTDAGKAPAARDAALVVQSYFRYTSGPQADALEAYFQKQSDRRAAMSAHRLKAALPKAEKSSLQPAVEELLAARGLGPALQVLAGRFNGLRKMVGSLEDVVDEAMPLGEIFDVAVGFKGSISDFVETIEEALSRGRASQAGQNEDDGVSLLTYFRSKGRQWHTVFLTTCNEGLIPHRRAPLEDERRLFYVAITRATSNLVLSYLKKACGTAVAPSRFLAEAAFK